MKEELAKIKDFRFDGDGEFDLSACPTSLEVPDEQLEFYEAALEKNAKKIAKLQEKLFAAGEEGVVFLIQAMDAAGKDSTAKHVLAKCNPVGIFDYSFRTPTKEELAHDYLWRGHCHMPVRGEIGFFNRSYYEDVLVVRVNGLWKGYKWPKRCFDMDEQDFFDKRFRQIRDYERYLYENGYRVVKIFLNVSLDEQANRFIRRIDKPDKNYKFSAGDLGNRAQWEQYMAAFQDSIAKTSTKKNPWFVIPADQKPVARYLASEALLKALKDIDPEFPEPGESAKQEMAELRAKLVAGEI